MKKDLNHFLTSAKRAFGPFEYVWCLEFQKRGAPHIHLATTLEKPDFDRLWRFAEIWVGITVEGNWWYSSLVQEKGRLIFSHERYCHNAGLNVHTHQTSWEAVKKKDGVGRYFAKYVNKLRSKDVPSFYSDVGRFWGASRGVKLPEGKYYHGTDNDVRELAAEYGRRIDHWEVLPKIILLG